MPWHIPHYGPNESLPPVDDFMLDGYTAAKDGQLYVVRDGAWIPEPASVLDSTGKRFLLGLNADGTLRTSPPPPTNVIVANGDEQVTVAFTPPARDGGAPITEYRVVASPPSDWGITTGPASPLTVQGLTNGREYTFAVTAINAVGESDRSDSATIRVGPPPPPADDFNRADGPPGVTSVGAMAWADPKGAATIVGNQLRIASVDEIAANTKKPLLLDFGRKRFRMSYTHVSGAYGLGFAFFYKDESDYYYSLLTTSTAMTRQSIGPALGSDPVRTSWNVSQSAPAPGDRFTIEVDYEVRLKRNGNQIVNWGLSQVVGDYSHQSRTVHGLVNVAASPLVIDDFLVEAL